MSDRRTEPYDFAGNGHEGTDGVSNYRYDHIDALSAIANELHVLNETMNRLMNVILQEEDTDATDD